MRAAIYARFSTDQQDYSSIQDQFRVCEERAQREGWEVVSRFEDAGISGAAIGNRPGFNAMVRAAAGAQFDVLLVMELSRLSRSIADLNKAIDRLVYRDVRIIGVSNGYDSERKGHKLQAGLEGIMGEAFREMISDKTYTALHGRAQRGQATGGKCYGYTHTVSGTADAPVYSREINEDEAAIVREMFESYADGKSPRAIAEELNRRGVPSPGAKWKRSIKRKHGWVCSAIAGDQRRGVGILNNQTYVGRSIWNRMDWVKDPDTGRRRWVMRPQSEWITQEKPELRIIPDELWNRVKGRQGVQTDRIGQRVAAGMAQASAKSTGRGPKYLFSSLLQCGCCGANFTIVGRDAYGCASQVNGGSSACSNTLRVKRSLVESKLLAGIKEDLLKPEIIEEVGRRVRRIIAEQKNTSAAVQDPVRISELKAEIENLTEAIASGLLRSSPALAERLARTESELARMTAAVADNATKADKVALLLPRLPERYKRMVSNLEEVALRDVERARASIRRIVGDKITLRPAESGDFLQALVGLEVLEVLSAVGGRQINMVAGTGFEPVTFGL